MMALTRCSECEKEISDRATTCPHCGFPIADNYEATEKYRQPAPKVVFKEKKSRSAAILLAMLLGGIGLHKFYLNKPGQGVLYLLFFWTFIPAIIGFLEGITYLSMTDKAFGEQYQ